MTKFYQACFSRLGGNDIDSGWQTLNLSEGMPRQLKELFESAARADQPADYDTPRDQNGNYLCMLEIISDGNNVGISRVQYGLSDAFGRENMFCHGYLFPNAYTLLKDPNQILRVSDSNFHFTPEETAEIPQMLDMQEALTEKDALAICAMDTEGYVRFISCVYYALATNAKTTIYVRTDGSDRMARALMYLVYSAIPYSLRTKVTAATYAHAQNTRLVFSPKLPESGMYIDPVSGDNNILTSNLQNRWKRYPFVAFFAQNYAQLGDNKEKYFQEIEQWLTKMGNAELNNMDALRLAFDMMRDKSDLDAAGLLYDWLVLPVPNNETLEQCVYDLLKQVVDQGISLGSDTENVLAQRLETAMSKELIELGYQYHAAQLTKKPSEEAVAYIDGLVPESRIFNAIRENLSASEVGRNVLLDYYLHKAKAVMEKSNLSYEELGEFAHTFSDLSDMEAVWDEVVGKAQDIAEKEIVDGGDFAKIAIALHAFFQETYPAVFDGAWEECVKHLAIVFDERFKLHFNSGLLDEYTQFYTEVYADHEFFLYSADLLKKYRAIQIGDYVTAAQYVAQGCMYLEYAPSSDEERRTITNSLLRFAFGHGAAEKCMDMRFWTLAAKALGISAAQLMLQKQASLFHDPEAWSWSVENDEFWDTERAQLFYADYKSYVENNPDAACKRSADILNKDIRRRLDEEKKQERERKRQERNEARAERKKANNRNDDAQQDMPHWPDDDEVIFGVDLPDGRESEEQTRTEQEAPKEKGGFFSFLGGGKRHKK